MLILFIQSGNSHCYLCGRKNQKTFTNILKYTLISIKIVMYLFCLIFPITDAYIIKYQIPGFMELFQLIPGFSRAQRTLFYRVVHK